MDNLDLGALGKIGTVVGTGLLVVNQAGGIISGSYQASENMIFETIPIYVLILGLILGAVGLTAVAYWFKYQDYQAKKDVLVKFDRKYLISAGLTGALSLGAGFVVLTVLVPEFITGVEIVNPVAAAFVAFIVGAVMAFFIDTLFFHPLADGAMAKAYNKAQKATLELIKTEKAQEVAFLAFKDACDHFGIVDEEKIKKLHDVYKGDVAALSDFLEMLKGGQE